uniref:Plasmodium vivax Vir protein n=1 Tax=Parastrongyloides trichosuri TaxID=131310 RepID=A0A0N4ZBM8_PARTI
MITKKYLLLFFLSLLTYIKAFEFNNVKEPAINDNKENSISQNIKLACKNNPYLYVCSIVKAKSDDKLKYLKDSLITSSLIRKKDIIDEEKIESFSPNVYECLYKNLDDVCERKKCFCLNLNGGIESKKACDSWITKCSKQYQDFVIRKKQPNIEDQNKENNSNGSKKFKLSSLKDFSDFRAQDQTDVHNDLSNMGNFHKFDSLTDQSGVLHRARSRSPWVKPGLWEANPDNPHNRDHANKWYYHPRSATADWLSGQVYWGAHWAVPAASVGGTDGFSAIHFPSVGSFLDIADDYD